MMRKRFTLVFVIALCLQLLVPVLTAQAIVEPYDVPRLVRESVGIVWGHVLDVVPHWNADQTAISSTVRIGANQYIKGVGAREFTLEVPGGEVDGIGQWTEDAPVFADGEEVVLFLDAQGDVLGWNQGKCTVADGRVLERDMMPLEEFIWGIQGELKAQGHVQTEAVAEKGLETPVGMQFVTATLDPTRDLVIELPADVKEGVETELAVDRDASYSIIKSETWEGVWPGTGWSALGTPTWDDESYRAFSGSWSAWCAGSTLSPSGAYANNMSAWMIYGPFSLSGVSDADMWLYHWTKTEANHDWFQVMSSGDGTNFSGYQVSGNLTDDSGNINGWLKWDYNLSHRIGDASVWIACRFVTDASITISQGGTFVDDLVIWKGSATGNAPKISNVNPTSRPAGTSSTITIWGRAFGATQGASSVAFWHNGAWTSAPIVSWSDAKVVCRVPAPASSHTSQGLRLATSAGTSYFGFTITYSYHGWKWPSVALVKYYIGPGTADTGSENAYVKQAAYSWTNTDTTAYALKYFGTTTRPAPARDNYNVLRWGATSGSIATCTTWYSGSNILEFDVVFNDAYNWSAAATCPADRMDVQNIATHEMGHGGVGFYDLYGSPDSEKTMYGYAANGETKKRSLYSTDISGINWIY